MAEQYYNQMLGLRVYLDKEKKTDALTRLWQERNQWYLDLWNERRERIGYPKEVVSDFRSARPLPNSTGHEIGWLVDRPEFMLDPPYLQYLKLPAEGPPPGWKPVDGACLAKICPWNPIACYCLGYRPKLRKHYVYPRRKCPIAEF